MSEGPRAVEILIVEDNRADAQLTIESFEDAHIANRARVVPDGVEALAYLRRERDYADAPRPDLILLDLNLPRKDGRRVLEELKADPALRSIPVVIMTTSKAEADVEHAYAHHASAFVTKPIDIEEFLRIMRQLQDFWLAVVTFPGRPAPWRTEA